MTFPLVSVLRNTTDPSAAAPCTWNQFFARSNPIMPTLSMDAPSFPGSVKVDATMAHCDAARQGASIPSLNASLSGSAFAPGMPLATRAALIVAAGLMGWPLVTTRLAGIALAAAIFVVVFRRAGANEGTVAST